MIKININQKLKTTKIFLVDNLTFDKSIPYFIYVLIEKCKVLEVITFQLISFFKETFIFINL
jgi:hypothetical protein